MPLFEITLVLLTIAVVLMRVAKALRVPYPSLLALAGGCVAVLPFAPHLAIEPHLAMTLFVAPAVMDTAFDMPPRELMRNWLPLIWLAVVLVLLTAAAVAWAGVVFAGLPVAAAIALGAIVAPPDAAAAAAVLREFQLPRRTLLVLQGESLLNDAVALLAFGLAVSAAVSPGKAWESVAPGLLIAVPGGAAVGVLTGMLALRLFRKMAGTLSLILSQFLLTFITWIIADRLSLSPIVAVVALAGLIAWYTPARANARDRLNSNAVWATVVFVLNVLAFLLMGLQARLILDRLHGAEFAQALRFAGIVLAVVIGVRFAWVMLYGFIARAIRSLRRNRAVSVNAPQPQIGVLVSWCGMRGLVTLATALALPETFPGRDLIVLSAFVVVLGTLILQGFTMRPLIALLHIAPDVSLDEEVANTRNAMLDAALQRLGAAGDDAPAIAAVRAEYAAARALSADRARPATAFDTVRMQAIAAERRLLIEWRRQGRVHDDAYHLLEDELDRAELYAASFESSTLDG